MKGVAERSNTWQRIGDPSRFTLDWSIDGPTITFRGCCPELGYVAYGINSENPTGMAGTDIFYASTMESGVSIFPFFF